MKDGLRKGIAIMEGERMCCYQKLGGLNRAGR
jgi:hypothetical protein